MDAAKSLDIPVKFTRSSLSRTIDRSNPRHPQADKCSKKGKHEREQPRKQSKLACATIQGSFVIVVEVEGKCSIVAANHCFF